MPGMIQYIIYKGGYNNKIVVGKALCLSLMLYFLGSYLLYTIRIIEDLPKGDHWRWLKWLLIPYENQEISLRQYLLGEFVPLSHSHILTLANVLLNKTFSNLNYKIEAFIGLGSWIVTLFVLLWHMKSTYRYSDRHWQLSISVVVVVAIFCSIGNVVNWTLVQFEYIYFFFALTFLIFVEKIIYSPTLPMVLIVGVTVLFWLGDAMGVQVCIALVGYFLLSGGRKNNFIAIGIITAIILNYYLASLYIPSSRAHHTSSTMSFYSYAISNLDSIVNYVMNYLGNSLVVRDAVRYVFPDHWQLIHKSIGAFVFLLYLLSIKVWWRRRLERNSVLPSLLVVIACISLFSTMYFRIENGGEGYAYAGRYVRYSQLGILGLMLLGFMELWGKTRVIPEGWYRNTYKYYIYVTCVFIVSSTSLTNLYKNKFIDSNKKYNEKIIGAIVDHSVTPSSYLGTINRRCANSFCDESILFLKKNNLSVFRKND